MIRIIALITLVFVFFFQKASAQKSAFQNLKLDFLTGYEELSIPPIRIAYLETLNDIPSKDLLIKQERFFKSMAKRLKGFNANELSSEKQIELLIMEYELSLNLDRIELSKSWNGDIPKDEVSIYDIDQGKQWYAYLLKRWVDVEVTPDSLFVFGKNEVRFVEDQMNKIRNQLGYSPDEFQSYLNDSSYFIHEAQTVQNEFEETQQRMKEQLRGLFPYESQIQDAKIAKGENPSLAHVPAYYNANTFYYNFFKKPFNKRQIEWIYAHEAFPGHHYQLSVNDLTNRSEIQDLFWYPGFVEGWGAYVEYLDIYSTLMYKYGKWEWDLIRSVRVVLDVGINYYGWDDEMALAYWKKHIFNQDEIARREINRMKRWPAQVITYKYGAKAILDMLKVAKKSDGFNYASFHENILKHGDIPISILKKKYQ